MFQLKFYLQIYNTKDEYVSILNVTTSITLLRIEYVSIKNLSTNFIILRMNMFQF